MKYQKANAGFTLVELSVTLVIGLLVTGAGLTVYLETSSSRRHIKAEIQLQESSYFITQTLRNFINQAGYKSLDTNTTNYAIFPVKSNDELFESTADGWSTGQYIRAVDNGLEIRFTGASDTTGSADGSIVDCQGSLIGQDSAVVMRFTVDDGSLNCTSTDSTVEMIGELDGVRVEDIAIYWGIDTNQDLSVDIYRHSDNTVTSSESIISVRLRLLIASLGEVHDETLSYMFDSVENSSSDKRIRREYVSTIKLKN